MDWVFLFYAVVLFFGLVVFFGAPYLPTKKKTIEDAFKLADLQPGQTLLELGSGDGRVLLAAAKRGVYAIGYELNPILVVWSWLITLRYRRLVKVRWGNYWLANWPETDVVYVFLLQKYMKKLDNKIVQTYFAPHRKCSNGSERRAATPDASDAHSLVPEGTTSQSSKAPVATARRSSGRCLTCGVELGKKVKLVSLAFTVPEKKPAKKTSELYLYTYR